MVPSVSYEDIGGLKPQIQHIREMIEFPLRFPEVFNRLGIDPPKGVLLHGPPGCGKTLVAKAIANESRMNFISVKGPAFLSMYVRESERGLREVFRKARQAAPCIIFFDEIDALVPLRSMGSSDSHVSERVLSQFLAELDGIEELKGVLVLGATNRADLLDPAVFRPGRFDTLVEIPLPDEKNRKEIFDIHLKSKPLASGIRPDVLASKTEGFTGAEIAAVCSKAALKAVRRAVESEKAKVLFEKTDIESALTEVLSQ
jgi:transitional endoplasmic reticulum ATPase